MRKLGIDYGDSRVGIAITDALGITAQGLETISHNGNDKVVLKRLDEIFLEYEVDTIVVGMPYNMDGTKVYYLCQKPIYQYNLKEFIHACRNSVWKTGFMKSAFKFPFPYYFIYELIKK